MEPDWKYSISIYKNCDAKYIHAHQVLNIVYYNPLDNIKDLWLDDTRTVISFGATYMIKGEIIAMVTSLETDTNCIQTTNILNKCPMYTTDKEGDIQTLSND